MQPPKSNSVAVHLQTRIALLHYTALEREDLDFEIYEVRHLTGQNSLLVQKLLETAGGVGLPELGGLALPDTVPPECSGIVSSNNHSSLIMFYLPQYSQWQLWT